MKATYNKSKIMRNAWYLKRANASMSFSACLKKAWRNADKRAFNTSHSCNSSCIVFILFSLLHLDKFAAMRAGDCVRRVRCYSSAFCSACWNPILRAGLRACGILTDNAAIAL